MDAAGFRKTLVGAALLATSCTGIAADQRTFDGTRWRVTSINGQATPDTPNYRIEFARGRIGGQFGCNHFGGEYRVRGATLTTGAMAMTEMACSGPADRFEGLGLAVLPRPLRMDWASASRLSLVNELGSITLERVP